MVTPSQLPNAPHNLEKMSIVFENLFNKIPESGGKKKEEHEKRAEIRAF